MNAPAFGNPAAAEIAAIVSANGLSVVQALNKALNARGYCLYDAFQHPAAIPKSEYDLAFQTSEKPLLVRNQKPGNSGMNKPRQRWHAASLVSAQESRQALARKALAANWNGRCYVPEATPASIECKANTAELRKCLLEIGHL